jgi:hypothetical protein
MHQTEEEYQDSITKFKKGATVDDSIAQPLSDKRCLEDTSNMKILEKIYQKCKKDADITEFNLPQDTSDKEGNFKDWYAKTKDYGGTYEEWIKLQDTSDNWQERFDTYIIKFLQTETSKSVVREEIEKIYQKGIEQGRKEGMRNPDLSVASVYGFEAGLEEGRREAKQDLIKEVKEFVDITIPDATISNEYYLKKDTIISFLTTLNK